MTEREKIAKRIRDLRGMTTARGCTEAEALQAAEMLAKLLAKHNMTVDEAELRETPFTRHTEEHVGWVGERLWKVADGCAHLTGSRWWTSRPGVYPIEINFFGFEHEVEVSRYLLEVCRYAMQREEDRILDQGRLRIRATRHQRAAVAPFLDGMADRLRERIRALKPVQPPGTGLVVLHDALIVKAMEIEGIKTEQRDARASRDFDPSYFSGRSAGDRVSLNRGLRGDISLGGLLR